MDQPEHILKDKLKQITEESALAFTTTLFTLEGVVKSDDYYSFNGYIRAWGEIIFKRVKQNLIREGLIREDENHLILNYPEFESLTEDKREIIIKELGEFLFNEAWPYYSNALKEIFSNIEGMHILTELTRVGYSLDDTNVFHIMASAGYKYYNDISILLGKYGFFATKWSSRKHTYYRLFQPLVAFMRLENPELQNALLFVYIAQNVGGGFGVLEEDCDPYRKSIEKLMISGHVKHRSIYCGHVFETTDKGSEFATKIIRNYIENKRPKLEECLNEIPLGILSLFFLRWMKDKGSPAYGYNEYFCYCSSWNREDYSCLFTHSTLSDLCKGLIEKLQEDNLVVLAHKYVSTRGGEKRELMYVIAPEVIQFIEGYLKSRKILSTPLLPEKIQLQHSLFHVLQYPLKKENVRVVKEEWNEEAEKWGISQKVFQQEIANLIKNNFINEEGDSFVVQDTGAYRRNLEEEFLLPLVNYLEGKEGKRLPLSQMSYTPAKTPKKGEKSASIISSKEEEKDEMKKAEIKILLGKTEEGRDYFWCPLHEPNPHILIVGTSGSGKTQTAKTIISQLKRQGVPAFIIDFANEYDSDELVGMRLEPGSDVIVNPLDLLEGKLTSVIYTVSGILKKIYRLGDQQEALVRKAIIKAYENAGINENDRSTWGKSPPSFNNIKGILEKECSGKGNEARRAKEVLNRLAPIFDLKVFEGKTKIQFENVFRDGVSILLKNPPTDETKLATAEFFLRWLWYGVIKNGETKGSMRLIIVLDEAHRLAYDKSPVSYFLREGRKYGIGILLSTQQPTDFEDRELVLQNTSFRIVLQCSSNKNARIMVSQFPYHKEVYVSRIKSLNKGEAIIQTKDRIDKIKIIPYDKLV